MAQITLRLSDDLLERIEEATGPEESRSAFLRRAARDRLETTDLEELHQEIDRLREEVDDLDDLEERVDRLEGHPLYRIGTFLG